MAINKNSLYMQEAKTVICEVEKERAKVILNGMSEEEIKEVLTTIPSKLLIMDIFRRLISAESKLDDIAKRLEVDV